MAANCAAQCSQLGYTPQEVYMRQVPSMELLRAQTKANLRAYQMQAREWGHDQMSDEEIEDEIRAAREARRNHSITSP